ncbi:MAG: twin-arginine translocation signal domain-containing protein, partial [Nitrospira sp.]|nr:twin-arginine translocation signal domain-containing protein [Nitrospira sp.]MBS0163617.1 twin-arginine translocation signal domain-containing protein [Nitrospira sp.]MBS0178286.1 twin-arginine translocation signal domain-containing protein [Nitrospira sp.]
MAPESGLYFYEEGMFMMQFSRRQFLKVSVGTVAAVAV